MDEDTPVAFREEKLSTILIWDIRSVIFDVLNDMREEYGPSQSLKYAAAEEFVDRLLKRL